MRNDWINQHSTNYFQMSKIKFRSMVWPPFSVDITPCPMAPAGARWDRVNTYCVNVAKKSFYTGFLNKQYKISTYKVIIKRQRNKFFRNYTPVTPSPHNKPFISHPFPVNCMHSPYLKKRTSKPLKTRQPNIFFVYKTESIAIQMPKLDKNLNKMKCLSGIVSLVFMTGNKKNVILKRPP